MTDLFRLLALAFLAEYAVVFISGLVYIALPPRVIKRKRELLPSMIKVAPPATLPAAPPEGPKLYTLNYQGYNYGWDLNRSAYTFEQIAQMVLDDLTEIRSGIDPEDLGSVYSRSVRTLQGRDHNVGSIDNR